MTQIQLKVLYTTEVYQSLRKVGTSTVKITKKRLREVTKKAELRVKTAPPELPNQQYVRTGTYQRGVKLDIHPTEMQAILRTRAVERQRNRAYEVYVGGDSDGLDQARIHDRRWTKVFDAMEDAADELAGLIDRDIATLLRSEGFGI